MPTPATTTSVVPGPFVFTLTNVTHLGQGWPNGRGDRLAYSSWRSTLGGVNGAITSACATFLQHAVHDDP
jgi:hypothetical protein